MKYFSMFSGIGGFELGIERATDGKWECIGYSEIDKYSIQTYKKHFSNHKDYGNARNINPKELPEFDLLCGGFPCQSFSIAGKRKGFQDTRGTLFHEICRVVAEKKPRFLFLENVKGLLSADNGRCFATIISSLDELGYNVEWQVLNSKNFGVPQNRERVFIIGHLRGKGGQQVFPIGESPKMDNGEQEQIKMIQNSGKEIARIYDSNGLAPTLKGKTGGWQEPKIFAMRSYPRSGTKEIDGDRFQNIEINKNGVSNSLTNIQKDNLVIQGALDANYFKGINTGSKGGQIHYSRAISDFGRIRRLTPTECERLQGFPDGWTEGVSDTQRYKQCGNAVTVNVIEAIIRRFA